MRRQVLTLALACPSVTLGTAGIAWRPRIPYPCRIQSQFNPIARIAAGLVACGLGSLAFSSRHARHRFLYRRAACHPGQRRLQWVLNLPQVGPWFATTARAWACPETPRSGPRSPWPSASPQYRQVPTHGRAPAFASCGALYIWLRIPTPTESPPAPDQPVHPLSAATQVGAAKTGRRFAVVGRLPGPSTSGCPGQMGS
jgi:hypothetical protein